ncbi:hypothetical protein PYCC9005_002003 [Savitreella phatthalungensis]
MMHDKCTGQPPTTTDVVIVGNGPSALELSFLLHGNVPRYDRTHPHPDMLLHKKLVREKGDRHLYDAMKRWRSLTQHFPSNETYTTDAWPVNVLADALIAPADGYDVKDFTCVSFGRCDRYARDHVVFGRAGAPGGQWADCAIEADEEREARTLSYREHLGLLGYTYAQYYLDTFGVAMPQSERPKREEVAGYYAAYADRAGVADSLYNGVDVSLVERVHASEYIVHGTCADGEVFATRCRKVVFASGLYDEAVRPPPVLERFSARHAIAARLDKAVQTGSDDLPKSAKADRPVLVIGSGFSAADAVTENLNRGRRVIHLFKWQTAQYISPLKYCHKSAYPDYADVYRQMKRSAEAACDLAEKTDEEQLAHEQYVGIADCEVVDVEDEDVSEIEEGSSEPSYTVTIESMIRSGGASVSKVQVSAVQVMLGRRANMHFLEPRVRNLLNLSSLANTPAEPSNSLIDIHTQDALQAATATAATKRTSAWLAKNGLRDYLHEHGPALAIDNGELLCIGSLTGDTLVRFAHGAVIGAACVLLGV